MSTRQAEPRGAAQATSLAPVLERRRIVASKLAAPPLRPGIVDRPALLAGLTEAHSPVVLVSAPAGYGKTTLLALWRERDERSFAWVSLEAADNDPVAFVAAVVAALDPILKLDAVLGDSLSIPKPPLDEVVLPAIVDACAASAQAFVLVLDDRDCSNQPANSKSSGKEGRRFESVRGLSRVEEPPANGRFLLPPLTP
jgi:ATP/maltotriose-dependent transcriptional regulator MalT